METPLTPLIGQTPTGVLAEGCSVLVAIGEVVGEAALVAQAGAEVHAGGLVSFGVADAARLGGDVGCTVEGEEQDAEYEVLSGDAMGTDAGAGEGIGGLGFEVLRTGR